jgi:hypothetical protein
VPIVSVTVRTSTVQRHRPVTQELDGARYRFTFRYVKLTDRWVMDIANGAGMRQVAGLQLVLGVDLLLPYHHLDVPPGQLFALDTAKPDTETSAIFVEPGLDGFDARVLLCYRPVAEVVA